MKTTRPLSLATLLLALSACSTVPRSAEDREDLKANSAAALKELEAQDPGLDRFLAGSYAYAVFPQVGKGAYLVGGGYGRGIVYRGGAPVGYTDVTQASIGLQLGGQSFRQIIAFETKAAFEQFAGGEFALAGNVSAVIVTTGAAAAAKYTDGVMVFVQPIGGAMVEASVGGQHFSYRAE